MSKSAKWKCEWGATMWDPIGELTATVAKGDGENAL